MLPEQETIKCAATDYFAPLEPLNRSTWAALLVILALAFVLRVYGLGNVTLWLDEQGQLRVSQSETLSELWSAAGKGGPIGRLSYLDTWLVWHLGGNTRTLFRFPAVFFGTASVGMIFVLSRRWYSISTGLFAAALLAVNSLHIQYSREARGYALLVFSTLLWGWVVDRFVRMPTVMAAAVLVVVAEVGLQNHPVFLAPMGALGGTALIVLLFLDRSCELSNRLRTAAILAGAMLLSAVILYVTPREGVVIQHDVPKQPHSLAFDLVDIVKSLLGGYWGLPSYLIAGLAVAGVIVGFLGSNTRRGMLSICAVSAAAAAPVVVGHFNGTWIVSRYSLFAISFLMMAPAVGLTALIQRLRLSNRMRVIAPILLAVGLIVGMWMQGRSPYDLERRKQANSSLPNLPP